VQLFCGDGFGPQLPPAPGAPVLDENGILAFNYDGAVKSVCDQGFGANEAAVVCRELYGPDVVVTTFYAA